MKPDLFLDSGAHSIYVQIVKKGIGKRRRDFSYIKTKAFKKYLDDYIAFVHKYKKYLSVYVNLDIIQNPEASFEVLEYMESNGLRPMPVLHYEEDMKWLYKYIDKGYKYIGLGGMSTREQSYRQSLTWIERVFMRTADLGIKYHGFAITKYEALLNIPWYSVDSTRWIQASRHGKILIPPDLFKSNAWDHKMIELTVSAVSADKTNYYKRLPKKYRMKLIEYLKRIGLEYFGDERRFNFTNLGKVERAYRFRDEVCAIFFKELENKLKKMPRDGIFKRRSLI